MWHCSYQELNNQDKKYRSREIFVTNKSNKKTNKICKKFNSIFDTSIRYVFQPQNFKISAPLFGCFIFFKEQLKPQVTINKMVTENGI